MSELSEKYFAAAIGLLERVRDEESANIAAAGALIAETTAEGGRLFAFGSGHSSLAAQDVVYRAGGLAVMNLLSVPGLTGVDVRPAPLGSALERVPGLVDAVLETSSLRKGDLLVLISLSGRQVVPVEMAIRTRERGLKVIGVTSLSFARGASPRHPSGTFLKDQCDVVVDSKIEAGDAELEEDGVPCRFGSASTVVTSAIMQSMVAHAVTGLAGRGITPPMLRSGNVDGGRDWNARVMREYGDRIFYNT